MPQRAEARNATVLGLNDVDKQKLEEVRQLAMSMTSHPVAFGTIEHTERAGELLGLLWQEVQRLQCDLKDALEPQSPTTADGPAALELSWVPLNKRDLNWHAHATTQLRAMHAALSAAEKTPRDPLENERLRDALQWIDGATAATPGLTDAELGRAMAAIGKKARDALGA